jgi:diguanylate cyclase (GGDEF)-like protein
VTRAWKAYAAGGAAVVAGYLVLPAGIPRDVAYLVVGASTVVAILVGVRVHRPQRPAAWFWVAAGELSWVVGDTLYSWFEDVRGVSPFPSVADAFYLCAYVLIFVGLVVLIRARRRGPDAGGLIDSALVAVALGLLSWVVVAAPIARDTDRTWTAQVIAIAYPAADIVLLALLVRLLVGPGARTVAYWLLASAAGSLLVADTAFAVLSATATFDGGAIDLLWLASYVTWGTAALHPTMRALSEPGGEPVPLTVNRLAALTVAILVAPCTLMVELILGRPLDAWPVTLCSIVLFALVAARMYLAMREIRASERSRDLARDHLAHQAAHDSLTQLANRARTVEMVEAALGRGRRSGALVGLLYVDIDHFKAVNDTYGHAAGDEVLRTIANRMRSQVREGDTVGRIGGDEFVVLAEAPASKDALIEFAERLLAAITAPVSVGGRATVVGASIGVAACDAGADADALLFEADAAAYRARALGRSRVEIFDDDLRREHRTKVELERAIRTGLDEGQFVLYYQPIVKVASRQVTSYEALVRWDRPGMGLVSPDEFIPIAELSSLICDLDRWVLREATRQAADGGAGWGADVTVAVNVSGRHVAGAEFVTDVAEALALAGLPAERLVVEITETVLLDQPSALTHLRSLKELGVGISIDDFGTGYTSIGQLQHMTVDTLKIDRSLVASPDAGAAALVDLVAHAAHAFGLTVVGEGVESEEQLRALGLSGCDFAQGYLFARPRPAGELAKVPKGVGR